MNTVKFKSFLEVYPIEENPIEENPIEVYPIEAYLIGKGVVEVSGCSLFFNIFPFCLIQPMFFPRKNINAPWCGWCRQHFGYIRFFYNFGYIRLFYTDPHPSIRILI